MLTHILIHDFAIIERLELDLDKGLCALTGETGAGKSILVDAIGLVLGDRADANAVRSGSERAQISATFDLQDNAQAQNWLREQDLDAAHECIIRRVIALDGRSRAYINGSNATLAMLRELGEQLVSIHGQHAHQALNRRDYQRSIVDLQAGNDDALNSLAAHYRQWQATHTRLAALTQAHERREERLDFLNFQIDELRAVAPLPGEYAELEEQHARLAHAGQLIANAQQAHTLLFDADPDVHALLTQALSALEEAACHDAALHDALELTRNAQIELDEAANALRRYLDTLELDPERLDTVESRIALLQSQARKHRCQPEELPKRLAELESERSELSDAGEQREMLQREITALERTWRTAAAAVSHARQRSAATLSDAVTEAMQTLGMEGGRFLVVVESNPDSPPSQHGYDRIEFTVSANPGQALQALTKVASGGELARISLAVQLAATHDRHIPTLIFDEVDSGIGGGVAEVVGRMLRALGARHQVLCVTHLAQVAAQAHQQFAVSKAKGKDSTRTRIQKLDAEHARIDEIARMLGGVRITEQTRAHAAEMLRIAQNGG
ncbi:DNA repair protein RecN [Acidihalobacter ferrooxydans]|uniref:DNA repair protein RecN n=1 Tax=Acidihalobacter ferrooxydans TaxID=1765967 RepID=A0A1P8UEH6_9GAMM|nr:DNA repair protein RecN [Acidihalobacter ferrooxydans]APZ42230.1 DNA repair protein RecN [Acidihalobacter ferrooxydans]